MLKVDSLEYQLQLGNISNAPRWAIAFKFPAQEGITTLLDIAISVGRTGAVKPVAVLDPVQVGGVTISRASLHNSSYIADRDIRIGDSVVVKRAGDVIPQIVAPVVSARSGKEKPWDPPTKCPSCGVELVKGRRRGRHILRQQCLPRATGESPRALRPAAGHEHRRTWRKGSPSTLGQARR